VLTPKKKESLISRLEGEMQDFINIEGVDTDLTGRDRQRLIISRVRNAEH